jgi:hypothetical protein
MSDDLDDYAPAIEPTSNNAESSVESQPAGKAASAAAAAAQPDAAGDAPAEKIGTPLGEEDDAAGPEPGPRRQRVWSGKSRALFQQLAAKGGVGADMADDLQPMEHAPAKPAPAAQPAPAAPPASPAAAPAPAQPTPAAPPAASSAPVTPPPGFPDLPDLPLPAETATPAAAPAPDPKHAEREQSLAAREAALAEREKLLPDRRALIEKPADAVIGWLADTYGITDPAELKTAVADLITDMSASPKGLGIGVPDEHINGMNSRRATRVVKTYASEVDKRERALKDREAQAAKDAEATRAKQTAAQQEAAYVAQIGERLAAAKEQFPFLHDPDLTSGQKPERIVYEVMQEQRKQAQAWSDANPGQPVPEKLRPSLATATQFADKYYRDQAAELAKVALRHGSRLGLAAPATAPAQPAAKPAAPAPAASASPGGAPGPAPTPAAKPEPQQPARDPSDLPDKRSSRAATLQKLRARAGNQPTT